MSNISMMKNQSYNQPWSAISLLDSWYKEKKAVTCRYITPLHITTMKQYTHLSKEARESIYWLLLEWKTKKEIALVVGRSPSTITREILRNSTLLSRNFNHLSQEEKERGRSQYYHYLPDSAQSKSDKRRKEGNWRSPLKNTFVFSYVIEHLHLWWSPDIISGNLKLLFPLSSQKAFYSISHECIYQFIYSKKGEELELKSLLLRSHKRRRKQTGRSMRKLSKIVNRRDISLRKNDHPLCEMREEFGHFEWDSILSTRTTYSALRTEIERKSRFLFVRKIKRKNAEYTKEATIEIYRSIPKWALKSITWDNGSEHTKHEDITNILHAPIYFAEPYKSWQRWSNEHGNGMIRRFFPKGTNFDDVSDEEIQNVVNSLNNRPRKILWYQTPKQVFDSYLHSYLL